MEMEASVFSRRKEVSPRAGRHVAGASLVPPMEAGSGRVWRPEGLEEVLTHPGIWGWAMRGGSSSDGVVDTGRGDACG